MLANHRQIEIGTLNNTADQQLFCGLGRIVLVLPSESIYPRLHKISPV